MYVCVWLLHEKWWQICSLQVKFCRVQVHQLDVSRDFVSASLNLCNLSSLYIYKYIYLFIYSKRRVCLLCWSTKVEKWLATFWKFQTTWERHLELGMLKHSCEGKHLSFSFCNLSIFSFLSCLSNYHTWLFSLFAVKIVCQLLMKPWYWVHLHAPLWLPHVPLWLEALVLLWQGARHNLIQMMTNRDIYRADVFSKIDSSLVELSHYYFKEKLIFYFSVCEI